MTRSQRIAAVAVAALAAGWVLMAPGTASAAATLTISSTCGPAKASIAVSGTGVVGLKVVLVLATRPNGDYVGQARGIVNGDGSFSLRGPLTFDVSDAGPGRPAPPAVQISIWDQSGRNDSAKAWYHVTPYSQCGTVYANPQHSMRQPGGTAITVSMYAFSPITPIRVRVPGADETPVPADLNGSASVTIMTNGLACGVNTIVATQASIDHKPAEPPIGLVAAPRALAALPNPPDRTATTRITVYCPSIGVSPASFGDTALPASSTATGSGWYVLRSAIPVQLSFDGVKLTDVTPSLTGTISTRVRIPRARCGVHKLTALQTYDNHDGFSITLTAETVVTVRCAPADLAVEPAVTEAGRTVDAVGASFVAGRTVTLEWTALDGRPLGDAGTVTVNPDGTFQTTILVMPNSDIGARKLHAFDTPSASDSVGAREGLADLLIVPGSMTPGRGHFLERR